jgi:hypothetical protein
MEPVTTATSAISLAKAAAELSKKLYEFGKNIRDREIKQQLDEIHDQLRDFKQSASELEDENRDLREKLRFKSDEFEFRKPFWYEKSHRDRALCPKCFSKEVIGPMGELGQGCSPNYRRCLVCDQGLEIEPERPTHGSIRPHGVWS